MVFANRLPILLILVTLSALGLEVERASHSIRRFGMRWLIYHRTSMMSAVMLLVSCISGPAAGRMSTLLEPLGTTNAAAYVEAACATINSISLTQTHLENEIRTRNLVDVLHSCPFVRLINKTNYYLFSATCSVSLLLSCVCYSVY